MKAMRFFYNKATQEIVWTHGLEGLGAFPTTETQDLIDIPNKRPHPIINPDGSTSPGLPLGGIPRDYECYGTEDQTEITRYFDFHGASVTLDQVRNI